MHFTLKPELFAKDGPLWLHPSHLPGMRAVEILLAVLVSGLMLSVAMPPLDAARGIAHCLPLQVLLETGAIVVSVMVCAMAMGEYFFAQHADVMDPYGLLGHVYKCIAYVLVCRAIMFETIELPCQRLSVMQAQMQASYVRLTREITTLKQNEPALRMQAQYTQILLKLPKLAGQMDEGRFMQHAQEQALRGQETASVAAPVAALQADMRGLAAVPAQLREAQVAVVLAPDHEQARGVLEQLAQLLASDDTAAADLFESHRALLLATHGAAAMRLGRLVAAFDYPGALATLRGLPGQTTC